MEAALREAALSSAAGEVPVGAVVVHHGEIIAAAHNQPIARNDPTAHAEILALRAAAAELRNYRLDECDLYVTLEPCTMCAGAMVHARIRRLYFGAADPKAGAAGSLLNVATHAALNHRMEVIGGVLAGRSAELLQAFFRERRGRNTSLDR